MPQASRRQRPTVFQGLCCFLVLFFLVPSNRLDPKAVSSSVSRFRPSGMHSPLLLLLPNFAFCLFSPNLGVKIRRECSSVHTLASDNLSVVECWRRAGVNSRFTFPQRGTPDWSIVSAVYSSPDWLLCFWEDGWALCPIEGLESVVAVLIPLVRGVETEREPLALRAARYVPALSFPLQPLCAPLPPLRLGAWGTQVRTRHPVPRLRGRIDLSPNDPECCQRDGIQRFCPCPMRRRGPSPPYTYRASPQRQATLL